LDIPGTASLDYWEAKQKLFHELRREFGGSNAIDAMECVPRELFVPDAYRHLAYEDRALPIGDGQTISQPSIVAIMTRLLELKPSDKVLDVGTGSGYQAAILSLLVEKVISVERLPHISDIAKQRLSSLGYSNVQVAVARDVLGSPTDAPFDGIIVAAGAREIPLQLKCQMAEGGRMVIPVGQDMDKRLLKVLNSDGRFSVSSHGFCRFVPLLGVQSQEL